MQSKMAPGTWLRSLRADAPIDPQPSRPQKVARVLVILAFTLVGILAVWRGLVWFAQIDLLASATRLETDVDRYAAQELRPSALPSRQWMSLAIEIVKEKSPAPPAAARIYAYAASAYADGLAAGGAPAGGRAAAEVLKLLVPNQKAFIHEGIVRLEAGPLTPAVADIVAKYAERMKYDNAIAAWDRTIPAGDHLWYIRNNQVDGAAKSGEWSTWLLDASNTFDFPDPPAWDSFAQRVEQAKVSYASEHRSTDDIPIVLFWHGTKAFVKGQLHDNVTPAGVWQNILVAEAPAMDDAAYAEIQKVLAQAVADAFIECWKVKYEYWSQRPSMQIENLETVVSDPPFPSYPSGHATISAAAATVLSGLIPEKESVWVANAKTAAASRLVGGIHFDLDNQQGLYLGGQIGLAALRKAAPDKTADPSAFPKYSSSGVTEMVRYGLMRIQPAIAAFTGKIARFQPWHRAAFSDMIHDLKIEKGPLSYGVSWADVDGDGWSDLALFGGKDWMRLYRNDGKGGFEEMTRFAGLDRIPNASPTAGIFGDYDNDGCADLFLSRISASDLLLRNDCKGRFTDVTASAGIRDSYASFGAAWADYDKDGWLDIYVANYGFTPAGWDFPPFEPNLLWHNNGDGTFTEVAKKAGVEGLSNCRKMNDFLHEHKRTFKESYQPVWFDYDNDGWQDLFVSTDSGVSPLYRNNKDGTFTEVTEQAGMCIIGTGMGVAVGDYDGNGWLDLYVTNTGRNFLWKNNANGTFRAAEVAAGVDDPDSLGWGTTFFDYDNDGDLDLYIVNGDVAIRDDASRPAVGRVRVDRLYQNLGDGTFYETAAAEGIRGDDPKEALGVADFNRDGGLDMFVMASYLQKKPLHHFYGNTASGGHWLELRLVASKGSPLAIGARVALTADGKTQLREVSAGGSFISQHELPLHFGLGGANRADLRITWPDGSVQELKGVAADQLLEIRQP